MYNSRLLYEGCHDTHITPRLLHLQDPVNITTTTALYDSSIYNGGGGQGNGWMGAYCPSIGLQVIDFSKEATHTFISIFLQVQI